jgi:hypothetical protein
MIEGVQDTIHPSFGIDPLRMEEAHLDTISQQSQRELERSQ